MLSMLTAKDCSIDVYDLGTVCNWTRITIHCKDYYYGKQLQDEILQGLRLLDIVKNTTIDMTERERSLLDLLLEESSNDKIVQESRKE